MIYRLYRAYDADGDLLYVGQSVNPEARMKHHEALSSWWPEAQRIVICKSGFTDERAARRAEAFAWEAPRENVRGAIRWAPQLRRAGGFRRVMQEQGRQVAWLARQLGVSRATLYLWADGIHPAPSREAEQVGRLLGVPAADLFERIREGD